MKLSELGQYKTVTDLGRENKREALLKEATLSLDFANNTYEVYERPVDGMTQRPFKDVLNFTRGSGATARTATGNIQTVGVDDQRLVGNREGLLIEEQRTNLLPNFFPPTRSFTDISTVEETGGKFPRIVTATVDSTGADSGSVIFGAGTSGSIPVGSTIWGYLHRGTVNTLQLKHRAASDGFILSLNFTTETLSGGTSTSNHQLLSLGEGWYFFSFRLDNDSTVNDRISISIVGAQVGDYFSCGGIQVEEGPFATSYIPTEGTQVTRAAENCSRTFGEEFNESALTILAKGRYLGGSTTGSTRVLFQIYDSGTHRFGFVEDGRFRLGAEGQIYPKLANWDSEVLSGDPFTLAISMDYVSKTYVVAINGVTVSGKDANVTPCESRELILNSFSGSATNVVEGSSELTFLSVYPRALSEAELITLTTPEA